MNYAERSRSDTLILLIEQDEALGDVLRGAFEDEGYSVRLASRAPSTEEVASINPDLLMLDVGRANSGEGWQLVQELKATPRIAHTPVVICSGDGAFVAQQDVRVRAEAAAILLKPFSLDDLLPIVATALAHREPIKAVHELLAEPGPPDVLGSIGF